jgi:multicomponent Na+:H+ antiporter subunit E
MAFIFYFVLTLGSYLFLTSGSGDMLMFWAVEEMAAGTAVSLITAAFAYKIVPQSVSGQLVNPFKWLFLTLYMTTPFFLSLLVANVEVIYRVITGKISPAVVKLDTGYKSGLGTFFLANSITLSPGTLSIEMDESDNSLYIHCLAWKKKAGESFEPKDVAPYVHYWLKKIYS